MRVLPCGDEALLVEVEDLGRVLGVSAAVRRSPPPGVREVVPAARTVLVTCEPGTRDAVAAALRRLPYGAGAVAGAAAEAVEIPVDYTGEDLDATAALLGWTSGELVRRHTEAHWSVAFCGFAPGFGYLVADDWPDVPRRASPRTAVPAGSVALAGPYSGVYPRSSPGGWQLVGRTALAVLDLDREPAALLRPGTRVRFVRL